MSQRIQQFFSDIHENWVKIYIWGFYVFSFMKSSFLTLWYIFSLFFIWSVNCSREGRFQLLLSVSKLYELSLWITEHISEMYSNVTINLYLRPCSIAIYGQFSLYCLYRFRLFFWSILRQNLAYKLCITFWKCQDIRTLFILKCI